MEEMPECCQVLEVRENNSSDNSVKEEGRENADTLKTEEMSIDNDLQWPRFSEGEGKQLSLEGHTVGVGSTTSPYDRDSFTPREPPSVVSVINVVSVSVPHSEASSTLQENISGIVDSDEGQLKDDVQENTCELNNVGDKSLHAAEELISAVQEEPIDVDESQENALPCYVYETTDLQLITGAWEEFKSPLGECFTKGCKWSPDGTCILTNSEDKVLRIFDLPRELHCQETWPKGSSLPPMRPSLRLKEGGCVYDYCWYPFMSSWNPLSCCLLATSHNSPIHLWDAYTGELRCSYRAFNSVDEVEHAWSVAFSASGERLYCGFKNSVRVFDTNRPGRECSFRSFKGLSRNVGVVSGICVNPSNEDVYAVCGYMRTIVLCVEPEGEVLCLLCNEGGGLTHMMFSPDGTRLYAGSRNDSLLFCWDMRNLGSVLFTAERTVKTHQRIYFDLSPDGRYLVSGSTDGVVRIWDTQQAPLPTSGSPLLPTYNTFKAHNDCVNGISLHKQYPILATSSGQRHFRLQFPDSDEEENGSDHQKEVVSQEENSLKLWWMGPSQLSDQKT